MQGAPPARPPGSTVPIHAHNLAGQTYTRLRQICNNDYQVPTLIGTGPPGDSCNEQLSSCCCNSIAFQLSMLCMNCQFYTVPGNGGSGIDAPGHDTYSKYLGTCGPVTNHSLPADIQQAVCNTNIRLDDYLYGGWDDGTWFYEFTKELADMQHAVNNNNTFTHCANQVSSAPPPTSTSHVVVPDSSATRGASGRRQQPHRPRLYRYVITSVALQTLTAFKSSTHQGSPTDDASSPDTQTRTNAIVGGVVGGAGALLLVTVVACLFLQRRRVRGARRRPRPPPSATSPGARWDSLQPASLLRQSMFAAHDTDESLSRSPWLQRSGSSDSFLWSESGAPTVLAPSSLGAVVGARA
ncbi:uncharacterized protein BXZ73DRAFT_102974 [Epithele typhae]|uniref:uncharacterized protein n=1 Tax=Epithele typhae TaxID=378194 RepID=UPI002007E417|nr:uncharacterized protein BXZ73DRAFT_102974 [Epithele typhae]KAH9926292.1 hypothetical protein BXZ73DRAFT_102974 [Epithele typhae]